MEKWKFGIDNDKLIKLVLSGKKCATSYLYKEELPKKGGKSILVFDDGQDACVVETIDYEVMRFNEMTEELSLLEGEGDLETWKKNHYNFFKSENKDFTEDSKIVFEIFKINKEE
ncbi:MAG: ASCH domain-containing protein [Bacilli bacterium]|nr:ASCH domain-containing protein [Bacilli bacterium]